MKGHFLNPTFWLNKKGWKFKMRQFGVIFKHCVHIVHWRTTECFSFSSFCRQKYFINKLILQGISVLSSGIHGRWQWHDQLWSVWLQLSILLSFMPLKVNDQWNALLQSVLHTFKFLDSYLASLERRNKSREEVKKLHLVSCFLPFHRESLDRCYSV